MAEGAVSSPERKAAINAACKMLFNGDLKGALVQFDSLHASGPFDASLEYTRGVALYRAGRLDEAMNALKALQQHAPNTPQERALIEELTSPRAQVQVRTPAPAPTPPPAAQANGSIFHCPPDLFGHVILTPGTLARLAGSKELMDELLSFHASLPQDEVVSYLDAWYREGLRRFGVHWQFLDIVNVLYAASKTLKPAKYLEIGVRRGRSTCVVARGHPEVNIVACDAWVQNYAGIDNPGPEFVGAELRKHGLRGQVEFLSGDSHVQIPKYFAAHPQEYFDLMTVDGDHSAEGAYRDLHDVLPHLALGGVIVFDDIIWPQHRYLLGVWRQVVKDFPFLSAYEYTEKGCGIAFAIRTC